MNDGRLVGKLAVITGASSSIGRHSACRFAAEGAYVLLVDQPGRLGEIVAEIRDLGWTADAFDVSSDLESTASAVAARCDELAGRVDVLFCCDAAIDHWPVEEDCIEHWADVFRINVLGPVAYTRRLMPLLRRSSGGSIVYLGSIDGVCGNPYLPAYSVTKGALVPLAHVVAADGGRDGVRANCLATALIWQPPPSAPPVTREMSSLTRVLEATPITRLAEPDDVVNAALFLASDEAAYISGVVIPIDGGRLGFTPGTGDPDGLAASAVPGLPGLHLDRDDDGR